MEVTETKSEGLSRAFTITIPAGELSEKLDTKIEEIRPQMRLKGFRPGKVPASHVKRMYGKSIMSDIIQEVVTSSSQSALDERELRPAQQPSITPEGDIEKVAAGDADLVYSMEVEIMPEFETSDVSELSLDRPVAEVADEQVDEALQKLAENNNKYEARRKGSKAKDGDAVVIDFVGKIDGEAFDGGSAEGQTIVLGQGRFIPGFEEQLVGVKVDDETELNVTFPEDYPSEDLKGKEAVFEVKVHEVNEPKAPEIDDDFAKNFGLEDLEALKAVIREQIEAEHNGMSRNKVKRALLDKLDEEYSFDLPPGMVEAEFNQIWAQFEREKEAGNLDDEDKDKSDDELKTEYRSIAERRVRLGLVLAEIGRKANIQVTEEEVARALNQEASRYPGQERQIIEFYQKQPGALAQIRAPIYEEKVVDHILDLAKVTDVTVSREELEKEDEM
ncbi:trigger factor [Ponticaulis sp.]|uniref:trigger factor n=1 Tax=Ponticaulis sp. TaxID=2020902 RepID=UPI000B6BBF67|nr:trigger factor [Ponticaulis sp.]MAI92075.1 trigger factor [Ponticaulis sp.]OUX96250.1 MAG: trigger factor [Hyphomonadaceae bacterium TMED5]|tara:strand:+ start:42129 stop:43466 length:1338 start_codon:yes stop_codon:yes gene_type:complete